MRFQMPATLAVVVKMNYTIIEVKENISNRFALKNSFQ